MSEPSNPNPNIFLTPAERFRQTGNNVASHRKMVDSPEFQRAEDAAMLQYTTELATQVKDGNSAMAVGFRLLGAMELSNRMRRISESPFIPKIAPKQGLNHEV